MRDLNCSVLLTFQQYDFSFFYGFLNFEHNLAKLHHPFMLSHDGHADFL